MKLRMNYQKTLIIKIGSSRSFTLLLNNYYMTNKKETTLTKEWSQKLETICLKAQENQLNLQTFYRTNKLKFPPLLQSKNFILNNFNSSKYIEQVSRRQNSETKQEETITQIQSSRNQTALKSRPYICPIIFKHIKSRRYSLMHGNKSKIGTSKTIDIDREVTKTVPKNIDKQGLKYINEEYTPKNSLSSLFNSFYTSRSIKDYNKALNRKESRDLSPQDVGKHSLNGSILVNNAVAVSPQRLFLQSLNKNRSDLVGVERELIVKRNRCIDSKRITVYKNANGIVQQKKKPVQKPRQMVKFQPWPNTNPEDEIHEIQFPEMKSTIL